MPQSLGRAITASIMKKQFMGITGLAMCLFLVAHLLGNFILFIGPQAYNMYSHALISNPFIYVAEAGLLGVFSIHVFFGMALTVKNRMARPQRYYVKTKSGRGETFASNSMPHTGIIALIFIVLHLIFFKFGPHYEATYDGLVVRDLYTLVIEYFQNPLYVGWYVVAVSLIGIHVGHGFWSAFQSLGLNHPKYMPFLKKFSVFFGYFTAIGYASIPIWAYFQGGQL